MLFSSSSFASQFSNIYVFGDSISDIGNMGIFTNHGGPNYTQDLAAKYGITLRPSSEGGTNFADGGAMTGGINPLHPLSVPIIDQVNEFVSQGPADSNALYIIQGGGNDFLVLIATGGAFGNTPPEASANLTAGVTALHSDGARYILSTTIPDIGRFPAVPVPARAVATALSLEFNKDFIADISHLNFDVIIVDSFGWFNSIMDNPTRYGFLPDAPTTPCPDDTGECAGYIFISDGEHITTETNQTLADYIYSILSAPNFYASLAETPNSIFNTQNLQIHQQLPPLHRPGQCYHWYPFASGSYSFTDNPTPNRQDYLYDIKSGSVMVGAKYVTGRNVAGFAYGHYWNNIDFDNNHGGFDADTEVLSLFDGYDSCRWFLNAIASYSRTSFSNIERRFLIGPASFVNNGGTHGYNYDFEFDGGFYLLKNCCFNTGPTFILDYNRASVSGYIENGADAFTAIAFGNQKFHNFTGSLGWQATADTQFRNFCLTSNLFVNVNRPWEDDERNIHFHLVTLPTTHGVLAVDFTKNTYVSTGLRTKARLCNDWTIGAAYEGIFGSEHRLQHIISVDLSIPLKI